MSPTACSRKPLPSGCSSPWPKAISRPKSNQLVRGQQRVLAEGITTVQDGATAPGSYALIAETARRGLLEIDVVALPMWNFYDEIAAENEIPLEYTNHFKVGGVKMHLDGSPRARPRISATPT